MLNLFTLQYTHLQDRTNEHFSVTPWYPQEWQPCFRCWTILKGRLLIQVLLSNNILVKGSLTNRNFTASWCMQQHSLLAQNFQWFIDVWSRVQRKGTLFANCKAQIFKVRVILVCELDAILSESVFERWLKWLDFPFTKSCASFVHSVLLSFSLSTWPKQARHFGSHKGPQKMHR